MASLRDIRRRIRSVKNTRQTTRAMKLVAGAKLRRATEAAVAAKPYGEAVDRVLKSVAASVGDNAEHPLLSAHDEVETVCFVVFGSDRGLCGGFNNNLFRKTEVEIKKHTDQGRKVVLRTFGKKAQAFFKIRGYEIVEAVIDLHPTKFIELTQDLSGHLTSDFEGGSCQETYLAYNVFQSVMTQIPSFPQVLPLKVEDTDEGSGEGASASADYSYEPGPNEVLGNLLPLYLQTLLQQAFLETEAGEHGARMTAMDSATRNAEDIIAALTLDYNRARQAAITTEIIEIVSGAAAL
jgi:F-type H+-transporting ATPase subunit gamma